MPESYKHFFAKQVLRNWLLQSKGKFFSLRWSYPRVYEEYPLLLRAEDHHPWDELPAWFCNCPVWYSSGLLEHALNPCEHHYRDSCIPTREQVEAMGFRMGAILDLAVVEKGRVKYGFEIVHTSDISPMKKKFLLDYMEKHDAIIYRVDAEWILRQIGFPQKWQGTKLTSNYQAKKFYRGKKNVPVQKKTRS